MSANFPLDDPINGDASLEYSTAEVDRFGVLANLKPLVGTAHALLAFGKDAVRSVWLESQRNENSR